MMALAIVFTQCKKDDTQANNNGGEIIHVTLSASYGNTNEGKTAFDPATCAYTWNNGTEYIYVGGSTSGYLGRIEGSCNESNTSTTTPISFSGDITAPNGSETVYFFYLGDASLFTNLTSLSGGAAATTLDFSSQVNGTAATVGRYLVAAKAGTLSEVSAGNYNATADLDILTSVACLSLNEAFAGQEVTMSGDGVYNVATINFKNGTLSGTPGSINLGTPNTTTSKEAADNYVVLIPSTNSATMVMFTGGGSRYELPFHNGIQSAKFYCDVTSGTNTPIGLVPVVSTPVSASGSFTIDNSGTTVEFAPGNLQYHCLNHEWRFAEKQYDICQSEEGSWNTTGWVDLFGWGTWTGTRPNPLNVSNDKEDYLWDNDDFRSELINNNETGWRTLTDEEWYYLFKRRDDATNKYASAMVCGVRGFVVLPDDWSLPAGCSFTSGTGTLNNWEHNLYDDSQWTDMEANGAVFLPCAGYRDWSENLMQVFGIPDIQNGLQKSGFYWSSVLFDNSDEKADFDNGYVCELNHAYTIVNIMDVTDGCSVRLVRNVN